MSGGKLQTDLIDFSAMELEMNDIEPWAEVIRGLDQDVETSLWLTKLYNATDDMFSTWSIFDRCPDPWAWAELSDKSFAAKLPLSRERRALLGGKIIRHLDSYLDALGNESQQEWLFRGIPYEYPQDNFRPILKHLNQIWGAGRQTVFEWAEFLFKVCDFPIEPTDGDLWESSGPRESIERLYLGEGRAPSIHWLNEAAEGLKAEFQASGVDLSWWDFETVICDFNVMTKGRYFPGKHLAMLRREIEQVQGIGHQMLLASFHSTCNTGSVSRDILTWPVKKAEKYYATTGSILGLEAISEQ